MENEVKSISDVIDIIKRRKWAIVIPLASVLVVSAVLVVLLPRMYRSTSTILIEEQEIPREYVMTTVTSFAEERLQTINQRVMSSTRLLEIINRFNLYSDLKEKWTTEEIVEKMRKEIKFETISANIIDRRTGNPTAATIAFSLAYEGKDPAVVQQIANVLASLYLEENLKVREQQTSGASKFLEEEMRSVQANLAGLDAKLAAFKQKNLNSLPELSQTNLQELDRTEREVDTLNDRIRTLRQQEGYLQTQLASIPTDSTTSDKTRLQELRVRLVELRSRYSDEYPDVKKTKSDIATLEKQVRTSGRENLAKPDNPAYVTLSSQLTSTQAEIDSVKRQIAMLQKKKDGYRGRIEASPRVEEGYKAILSERNNMQAKYDDLMKKYMEAKVAHGMEKEQMGERFTLIDAAKLPEKPVSPNVVAIMLIGLILGAGAGAGLASLQEYNDQSVRNFEQLARATGFPVLASIPEIVNQEDISARRKKIKKIILIVGIVVVASLLIFHFFIMDLDVFWARLMRRMGI
jgi:polysaccharide chain length determinant protein (PEP-CTERM system associated)